MALLMAGDHRLIFETAFYGSPHLVAVSALKTGLLLDVNDAFIAQTGYTREELIGASTVDLGIISEADRDQLRANMVANGNMGSAEVQLRRKDGSEFWVKFDGRLLMAGEEAILLSTAHDITLQKQKETELLDEKQRLLKIAASVPGLICSFYQGPNGGSLMPYVSPTVTDVFGVSAEEIATDGSILLTSIHTNDIAGVRDSLAVSARDLTPWEAEYRYYHRLKGERWIAAVAMPEREADGGTTWHGFFSDITQRKLSEEALRNMQRLESLGVLAGGIAHDFNNLLSGIFGYIDLAISLSSDSQTTEYLEAAFSAMNRMRALTMQLLTFSKGGAPVKKAVSLVPFLQETVQFALSGSSVSANCHIPSGLSPCEIDKHQIGQVIDNIVINAKQAMPSGGTIKVFAQNITMQDAEHPLLAAGNYVKISIQDFGIGMPLNIMSRIFDPFFTTKSSGHGLGLATCHSIIQRHGGVIEVESTPGEGTTFHVYLPAARQSQTPEFATTSRPVWSSGGVIIVMDDDEMLVRMIGQMLSTMNFTTKGARDGREVIDLLATSMAEGEKIVAMFFDLTVPGGMGGVETAVKIRSMNTEIPLFVVSGYSDDPVMIHPEEYGFTASISKPFTTMDLSQILQTHLQNQ